MDQLGFSESSARFQRGFNEGSMRVQWGYKPLLFECRALWTTDSSHTGDVLCNDHSRTEGPAIIVIR